jgi:uncharacterized protein
MDKKIARTVELPNKSFLLFGPRGVGKSTLLEMKLKASLVINLLISSQYIPLVQNPSLLREWTRDLKPGSWVVIDEVQKVPALMDEIHALYEERKLNFAVSGSSARKLKRGGANLLAARALQFHLFPLIFSEYAKQWSIKEAIEWGTLPGVVTDRSNRMETLATYVETYLKQELVEEGLIRKLEPFVRFLKVAGLYNAQTLNIENIAREGHLKRSTIDTYFEILEDTLIGHRLPAIQLGLQTKEVQHPKFYFFDSGVARASSGLIFEEVDDVWRGFAFETLIFNELRAFNKYNKKNCDIYYYKVAQSIEIDFLVETNKKTLSRKQKLLGIEVKYSKTWDKRWSQRLTEFQQASDGKLAGLIGIYQGKETIKHNGMTILPVEAFLTGLHRGDFF